MHANYTVNLRQINLQMICGAPSRATCVRGFKVIGKDSLAGKLSIELATIVDIGFSVRIRFIVLDYRIALAR